MCTIWHHAPKGRWTEKDRETDRDRKTDGQTDRWTVRDRLTNRERYSIYFHLKAQTVFILQHKPVLWLPTRKWIFMLVSLQPLFNRYGPMEIKTSYIEQKIAVLHFVLIGIKRIIAVRAILSFLLWTKFGWIFNYFLCNNKLQYDVRISMLWLLDVQCNETVITFVLFSNVNWIPQWFCLNYTSFW